MPFAVEYSKNLLFAIVYFSWSFSVIITRKCGKDYPEAHMLICRLPNLTYLGPCSSLEFGKLITTQWVKKTTHSFITLTHVDNIFSLSHFPWNLQQNPCHISYTYHTLKVLLNYLAKHKRPKLAKFCCMWHNNSCLMFTKYNTLNKICITWN